MQFNETVQGQNILSRIPTALKNLTSIDESLKVIANHYASEKTEASIDVLDAANAICLNCLLSDGNCDNCPITGNVQIIECNRKLELRYGPDINAKVFAAKKGGNKIVYGYFKAANPSDKTYDTAPAAYEALVKEIDGDIFKD